MSNFGQRLGARYGLESDELGTGAGEGEAEVVIDGSETVEGEQLEVAEAAEVVAEDNTELEGLEDSHESLEEVQTALESAIRAGGLSAQATQAYGIAISAAARRHGYKKTDTPALESIGGSATALAGTIALEAEVGAMLKQFWAAIWAKIKQVYESITQFFARIMDATPKIKKRAEDLKKAAGKVTTDTPKAETLEVGVGKVLSLEGAAPGKDKLQAQLKKLDGILSLLDASNGQNSVIRAVSDSLGNLADGKVDAAKADAIKTEISTKLAAHGSDAGKAAPKADRFGEDFELTTSGEILGNTAVLFKRLKSADKEGKDRTLTAVAKASGYVVGEYDPEKQSEGKKSFPALLKADIEAVADAIIGFCDKISKYKSLYDVRKKQFGEMDAQGKRVVANASKTAEGDDKSEQISKVKDAVMAQTTIWRNYAHAEGQLISYTFKVCNALFTYADKSLGNLGAKKEEKKGDAPAAT